MSLLVQPTKDAVFPTRPQPVVVREMTVPGIGTGAVYATLDALGTQMVIPVPRSGLIQWAEWVDINNSTAAEIDVIIYTQPQLTGADNAAFAPTVIEARSQIGFLSFVTFLTTGTVYKSCELRNLGITYIAPDGYLYFRAQVVGTPTIAAGLQPIFKVGILPDGV